MEKGLFVMSFSSFKDTKLIFESFRKFTNEAERDDFLSDDDDFDIDIPEPSAPRAPVTRAALDAAEAEREQKAAELADKRKAIAGRERAEMDAAFPDKPLGTLPDEQAASPQQRVQREYLNARRSGAGDESSGIARAMMDLQGDEEALNVFKAMVSGDETSGYSFVRKTRPQDRSAPQPRGTYSR